MDEFNSSSSLQGEPSVDIRQYLWLLWRWLWLILLVGVLASAAGYIFSRMQTPYYRAVTTVLVSEGAYRSATDSALVMYTNQQLAKTYAEMLTKKPLLDAVAKKLGLEKISASVSVAPVKDTQLLAITVEDTNPVRAADIANTLASVFSNQLAGLQASRYQASKDNLQNQLTYLEQQIKENSDALTALINGAVAKLQTQPEPITSGAQTPAPTPNQSELEARARELNQAEVSRLETRINQYRSLYASLIASFEQVRLAEAQSSTVFIQVEPAVPTTVAVRPQVMRNTALAAVVGLLLAIGVIFLIEFLDDTIKDPDSAVRAIGLPTLASIAEHHTTEGKTITQEHPRSPVSEAFRTLRTNLQYAHVDTPVRRIMVTSPTPEDGKTTVASNLAVVMSQGGNRVTFIDADMRRPRVHKVFGLHKEVALADLFVTPQLILDGAVQPTQTEGLSAIACGDTPPNPAELLGSRRMREILAKLEEQSDVIVLDTPPILSVTDAAVLSNLADGVILVVKIGQTHRGALERAVEQLRQVNARLLGVVVNDINMRRSRYYYYKNYAYNRYQYYYEETETGRVKKKKGKPAEA